MAELKTLTIHAGRKIAADYQSREFSLSATLDLEAGESVRDVRDKWTAILQREVDRQLGDVASKHSFFHTTPTPETRIMDAPPRPAPVALPPRPGFEPATVAVAAETGP